MMTVDDKEFAKLIVKVGQDERLPIPKEMPDVPFGMVLVAVFGSLVYRVEDPKDYSEILALVDKGDPVRLFTVELCYITQAC